MVDINATLVVHMKLTVYATELQLHCRQDDNCSIYNYSGRS